MGLLDKVLVLWSLDLHQQALLESQRALQESQCGFAPNEAGILRLLQQLSSRSLMAEGRGGVSSSCS